MSWSLPGFLKEQYPEERNPQLGSLITIMGSGDGVQALTCSQYMSQVWLVTGLETLSALQGALAKGHGKPCKSNQALTLTIVTSAYRFHVVITSDKTHINFDMNDSLLSAVIKGTEPAIAEIGQQLAWLGAALRSSPSEHRMDYSTPRIFFLSGISVILFKVTFQVAEIVPTYGVQRNSSCRRSLFRNPIIVEGYPILSRNNEEKGLEIPLNIMAGLGQASRVTNFGGVLSSNGIRPCFVLPSGPKTLFCGTISSITMRAECHICVQMLSAEGVLQ
jgi:hypothetical protein